MSHANSLPIRLVLAITLLGVVAPAARAQVAVFDIQAFVQLLTQVRTLQQQLLRMPANPCSCESQNSRRFHV